MIAGNQVLDYRHYRGGIAERLWITWSRCLHLAMGMSE